MRRINKYFVAICAFLLILLIFNINITAKAIAIDDYDSYIVVDKSGSGDFTSIQQAVNYANSGSTIYVKSGEYSEIITIKKSLSLLGESKDSTLINPISEKNKYAISLGASDIIVSGFTITNEAPGLYPQGIKIVSDFTKITECNIYNTPVGIAVWTDNNIIENCVFRGCKDEGIALLGSKHSPCDYNTISNCVFYDNCDGIELQYSSYNTISDCKLYQNSHSGIDAIASNNNENIISNCEIYDNNVHGLYLSSSKDNKILNCLINNNQDGNIVTNRYSINNQIINDELDESLKNLKSFINKIVGFLSELKTQRFQGLLNRMSF